MVRSIRVRLLLWNALILTAVLAGFATLLYYEVRAARLNEVDAELDAAAASLGSALRLFPSFELQSDNSGYPPPDKQDWRDRPDKLDGGGRGKKGGQPWPPPKRLGPPVSPGPQEGGGPGTREHLYASLNLPGPPLPPDTPNAPYFAVWRADGSLLKAIGYSETGEAPSAVNERPVRAFRGVNRERVERGPNATIMLVGRPAGAIQMEMTQFLWQLVGSGAAVLSIGLMGSWLISRMIVRPIATIATTASRISEANLVERIDTRRVDSELVELVGVLNAAFGRLQAAFERQAQFTADASHELRTPLAVIRLQAELTLSRPRLSDDYQAAIQTCLRAAVRMTGLVERLLTLARSEAGFPGLRHEPVRLDQVVIESMAGLTLIAEQKRVSLSKQVAEVEVLGDAAALAQVAENLISNAIHYNRPDGTVSIQVSADAHEATLSIHDTGPGIPEAEQAHIFERFYRVDKARSRASGGSGLGLAICKSIVEAHSGKIGFESSAEGTTFWVRLPIYHTQPPR